MKFSELKKLLRKNGCYFCEEGRKHEKWYSTKTGKYFRVGRHKNQEVKKGTLNNILTDAGIELQK